MRRSILTLCLAAAATAATAQNFRVGLKAGPSYTRLRGVDPDQLSSASNAYYLGFHAGVMGEFQVTHKYSIQAELLYSQKGGQNKIAPGYKTIFTYLDLPLLAKARLGETGIFVEAGPQFGYVARARSYANDYSYNVRDTYEKFDVGYVGGLGYQHRTGPLAGFRYNGGLTRLNKPFIHNGRIIASENTWNSAFQLYVGYMIGNRS
ncbi:PorT family protein [Hymenobacter sp. BT175]|uniref:porin family protein n=1 Tax=Hymenobacter translucens TaxID=2886507 RepID=UPI001D0EFAB1|nr:porin family protein [Hymenobacter translucens]MCC2547599.1 PorT family protein [Hymenobacter translucens]